MESPDGIEAPFANGAVHVHIASAPALIAARLGKTRLIDNLEW
ncbi:MAG: hypothetical protein ACTS8Z_00590 [Candidatus Limnocylindrales bacterium]